MPSRSKTQQRLMGQALAYKRGEIKSKDLNPSMLMKSSSSDNKLFHGKAGEYFKDRLFNHFGGFNPSLSKNIGW